MPPASAQQLLEAFEASAANLTIGVALCTIALTLVGFAVVGRATRDVRLLFAGLFSALYGIRLIANTSAFALATGRPDWLLYLRSSLEYLVPIPGAALFAVTFGRRWRKANLAALIAFVLCAIAAIPYEIVARSPFAGAPVVNLLVYALMASFALNIFAPGPDGYQDVQAMRWASAVFFLFVLNEHLRFVTDPWGITREPTGFLVFIGTVVFSLIRETVGAQVRLGAIDSELATARRIQMSIIPRDSPNVPGLEVATIYRPASEVAGDFFDFIRIDRDRLGVFVADVSGHGVPAALVASMSKIALESRKALAARPAELLVALNTLFFGKLERQFITAAYLFIDTKVGEVRLASGGHPAPLLRRRDGSIEELTADGIVLGRFEIIHLAERVVPFVEGDSLFVYSDGITEAIGANGEMWGEERLRAAIAGTRGGAREVAATIGTLLAEWTGGRVDDDVTFVGVSRI